MVFENERTTLLIERDGLQVGVVLIASRLVRRIVSFVSEGQEVVRGERIGMIRFGSQVDVVLPLRDDVRVTVEAGQRVKAAETVIGVFEPVQVVSGDLGPFHAVEHRLPVAIKAATSDRLSLVRMSQNEGAQKEANCQRDAGDR